MNINSRAVLIAMQLLVAGASRAQTYSTSLTISPVPRLPGASTANYTLSHMVLTSTIDPVPGTVAVDGSFHVVGATLNYTQVGSIARVEQTVIPGSPGIPAHFPFPAVPPVPDHYVNSYSYEDLSVTYQVPAIDVTLHTPPLVPIGIGGNLFSLPISDPLPSPWQVPYTYTFTDSHGAVTTGGGTLGLVDLTTTLVYDISGYPATVGVSMRNGDFTSFFATFVTASQTPAVEFTSPLGNHFSAPSSIVVPEPSSFAVCAGIALLGVAGVRTLRRRRK